jgi:hypothetical protein
LVVRECKVANWCPLTCYFAAEGGCSGKFGKEYSVVHGTGLAVRPSVIHLTQAEVPPCKYRSAP